MPHISVVLSALDRKSDLFENCWKSLVAQDYDDYDICVSVTETDAAAITNIIEAYPARVPVHLQSFDYDGPRGRAACNNIALDMATGDIIYMTQDDMVLPPNMLSSHAAWHAKHSHPIAVYNRVKGAFGKDDEEAENELWDRLSNPASVPIRGRWQYGSGHSFSYPASTGVRMREEFGSRYAFEDILFSWHIHKAGVWFYFDNDVIATHQPHGGDAWDRRNKGKEAFLKWLSERSINREVFRDIAGFCPEYGTWKE